MHRVLCGVIAHGNVGYLHVLGEHGGLWRRAVQLPVVVVTIQLEIRPDGGVYRYDDGVSAGWSEVRLPAPPRLLGLDQEDERRQHTRADAEEHIQRPQRDCAMQGQSIAAKAERPAGHHGDGVEVHLVVGAPHQRLHLRVAELEVRDQLPHKHKYNANK